MRKEVVLTNIVLGGIDVFGSGCVPSIVESCRSLAYGVRCSQLNIGLREVGGDTFRISDFSVMKYGQGTYESMTEPRV